MSYTWPFTLKGKRFLEAFVKVMNYFFPFNLFLTKQNLIYPKQQEFSEVYYFVTSDYRKLFLTAVILAATQQTSSAATCYKSLFTVRNTKYLASILGIYNFNGTVETHTC